MFDSESHVHERKLFPWETQRIVLRQRDMKVMVAIERHVVVRVQRESHVRERKLCS